MTKHEISVTRAVNQLITAINTLKRLAGYRTTLDILIKYAKYTRSDLQLQNRMEKYLESSAGKKFIKTLE